MVKNTLKLFLVFLLFVSTSFAGLRKEPKIVEHLGAKLPLNLTFLDASGNRIVLKDFFKKATIIDFAYYECPGICNPIMIELAQTVSSINLTPDKDYNLVTISIDDKEGPKIAEREKKKFYNVLPQGYPKDAWHFLTGDSASIAKITDAAGFFYKKDGPNFIHTGVLIFVDKDGKICRYLYPAAEPQGGFSILPTDFEMASMQTAKGTIMSMVGDQAQYCFASTPKGGSKLAKLLIFSGSGVLFLLCIFVAFIIVRPKKKIT
jgi:protein SCO1